MRKDDILRESPAYQWILEEGRELGREEGFEEGRKEGRQQVVQAWQHAAICTVVVHLSEIEKLARAKITAIDDLARLQQLILDLNSSHSLEEVEKILRSL